VSAEFQLVAGSVALDFANTLDNRGREDQKELLPGYTELLAFALQSGLLSAQLSHKLQARAAREPQTAARIVERARIFREAFNRIVTAIANAARVPPADLDIVNSEIALAAARTRLQPAEDTFKPLWAGDVDDSYRVLWLIVREAAALLTSGQLDRIRLCEADTCRWAFLDTSRNRTRRWCDMKICGNREKVRRFQQRQRASQ
jgi:predicted RNA-binding Zn ribbon-like protein